MFRIDDPSASPTLPTPEAAGTEGYWTEGNPAGGVAATLERASWFNMIQEELRAIVVAGGLTPSKTTYNQVLTAIKAVAQSNQASYAADTGVANALVATLSPAPAALSSGMPIRIHVAANNTGASTLNLNGLGALPITGLAGVALEGGELKAGVIASFILSDDKSHWVLTGCEFGASQLGAGSYGVTPPQFDSSTKLATMAAVQAALGNYSAATLITGSLSLSASWAGRIAALSGSTPYTVTLPPSASLVNGAAITFVNISSSTQTITRAGSDTITDNGNSLTSINLKQGDHITVVLVGAIWWAFGTGALQNSLSFATSTGSALLPNGRIRKWGSWIPNATIGAATAVTFPTAFPTSADSLVVCVGGQISTTIQGAWWDGFTTTGFNGHSNQSSGGCYYIAEGS